jgi:hypothetical protein
MSDFIKQNASTYNYLGNVHELIELIRREREAASYECLRIASDCL